MVSLVLWLFLLQLVVPALVIADILYGWHLDRMDLYRPVSDELMLATSVAWIVLSLGALVINRNRQRFLHRVRHPLTSVYTILLTVTLLEVFVRMALPAPHRMPTLRPPNTQMSFQYIDDGVTRGMRTVRFTVNEYGLRGTPVPKDRRTYKIILVGGSTTECISLDDSEAWPQLLMDELNQAQTQTRVWVANAGVSGHATVHHLALLETLPIFKQAGMLIFLVGQNDMGSLLAFEGQSAQSYLERDAAVLRATVLAGATPQFDHPYYKRLRLYELGKNGLVAVFAKFGRVGTGESQNDLAKWRKRRADAARVPLPPIETGLREYKQRIGRLAAECKALGTRCLFMTQPTMWRADLTPEEEKLLWGGHVGRWSEDKGYISAGDLRKAMDAHNEALLEVCRQDGLECFDLAARVPKDRTVFFDDSHMHAGGSHLVADRVVEYLLSRPPFASSAAATIQR